MSHDHVFVLTKCFHRSSWYQNMKTLVVCGLVTEWEFRVSVYVVFDHVYFVWVEILCTYYNVFTRWYNRCDMCVVILCCCHFLTS